MDKRIIGSVRIGSTVYREGQEEEFASKASAAEIASLTERGVIEGFGKSPKKAEPVEEAEVATAEMVVEDDPKAGKVAPKGRKKEK